jgi:hypothetical protein
MSIAAVLIKGFASGNEGNIRTTRIPMSCADIKIILITTIKTAADAILAIEMLSLLNIKASIEGRLVITAFMMIKTTMVIQKPIKRCIR